mmetsp:Transcript_30151/g.49126  ORF Transcript_30151/g.49126 Transcript_30151/m.49126 type:complete len:345 (+) Transcript_30151:323-1357(+)
MGSHSKQLHRCARGRRLRIRQDRLPPLRRKRQDKLLPLLLQKKKTRTARRKNIFTAESQNALDKCLGDFGEGLARAADGDPASRYLSAALSEGLKGAQAISKGNARLHSALAHSYSFEDANIYRLSEGSPHRMTVTFYDISKKKYKEEIDIIPKPLLKAILLQVVVNGGEDLLRPYHMARCSPRVFWSLVRAYGSDVEAVLRTILPNIDWKKFKGRKRIKSKKALENERQKLLEGKAKKQEEQAIKASILQEQSIVEKKSLKTNSNPHSKPQVDKNVGSSVSEAKKNQEFNKTEDIPKSFANSNNQSNSSETSSTLKKVRIRFRPKGASSANIRRFPGAKRKKS